MSSTKCVICEEQGKVGDHNGCENSCPNCCKFFESNVKEMTKSNHKFLDGKNVTRHCYNNFGCEMKGNTPCNSCRFLKCIENQMNPETPLKSAAKEVLKSVPTGQNLPLDYYTKELGRIYESNLAMLLSAAHEARANPEIKPAMISGLSKSETAQDSTIKCVICEAPKEEVKIGNHYGCNNSCITCRKFFESSVRNMTKLNHKFLTGKNADRHCYNNFGCQVKGKRPCTSCRFLKCINNHMNPELPLRSAAKDVQKHDPEDQNLPLDYYTKELGRIYESNLNILLSAAHKARANSKIEPAVTSGPANICEESSGSVNFNEETMSSKQCVICGEDRGKKKAKNREDYGCESSCDACQNFFGSSVKNMTKSSHKFLGGKKATHHCLINFGCDVTGKRPCNSCRFLKCIDKKMNPELPLRSAAIEVQRDDPDRDNKTLNDCIKVLRATYESNLNVLLSERIKPTIISGSANSCEESSGSVNSDASATDPSRFLHSMVPEAPAQGTRDNIPGNHTSNSSYSQPSKYFNNGHMPNVQRTYYWNNQNNGNGYTEFDVSYGSFPVSVHNNSLHNPVGYNSYMPAYPVTNVPFHYDDNTTSISHMGSYENTGLNSHTHGAMGQVHQFYPPSGYQSTRTLNHEVEVYQVDQSTPVPVGHNSVWYNTRCALSQQTNNGGQSSQINILSNEIYVPGQTVNHGSPAIQICVGANEVYAHGQSVNHAGPSTQMLEQRVQNMQLDLAVSKDIEMNDVTHETRSKRKSSTENVNEKAKRSISADTYHRLPITHNATELCNILDPHGMKMDMCHACDYENDAPPDKRCECGRSLGKPETDPDTKRKTLLDTTKDGPHHFANWMCFFGLLFDFLAVEIPKKELFGKSICPAGRCYQSHDLMEHFVIESEKEGGRYEELKKNELRSGDYYFIWCRSKDHQYWQIYYGTDDHCEAGYGHYPDYNERRYFFNKEFDQQRKDQTSSGK